MDFRIKIIARGPPVYGKRLTNKQWLNFICQTIKNYSSMDINRELSPDFTKEFINSISDDMEIIPEPIFIRMLYHADKSYGSVWN